MPISTMRTERPMAAACHCPVLFVNGDYDPMNTIKGNRLGDPMRAACADLSVTSLPGGHWLPVECKTELVEAISTWLLGRKLG